MSDAFTWAKFEAEIAKEKWNLKDGKLDPKELKVLQDNTNWFRWIKENGVVWLQGADKQKYIEKSAGNIMTHLRDKYGVLNVTSSSTPEQIALAQFYHNLYNVNHPAQQIAIDGAWWPNTESALSATFWDRVKKIIKQKVEDDWGIFDLRDDKEKKIQYDQEIKKLNTIDQKEVAEKIGHLQEMSQLSSAYLSYLESYNNWSTTFAPMIAQLKKDQQSFAYNVLWKIGQWATPEQKADLLSVDKTNWSRMLFPDHTKARTTGDGTTAYTKYYDLIDATGNKQTIRWKKSFNSALITDTQKQLASWKLTGSKLRNFFAQRLRTLDENDGDGNILSQKAHYTSGEAVKKIVKEDVKNQLENKKWSTQEVKESDTPDMKIAKSMDFIKKAMDEKNTQGFGSKLRSLFANGKKPTPAKLTAVFDGYVDAGYLSLPKSNGNNSAKNWKIGNDFDTDDLAHKILTWYESVEKTNVDNIIENFKKEKKELQAMTDDSNGAIQAQIDQCDKYINATPKDEDTWKKLQQMVQDTKTNTIMAIFEQTAMEFVLEHNSKWLSAVKKKTMLWLYLDIEWIGVSRTSDATHNMWSAVVWQIVEEIGTAVVVWALVMSGVWAIAWAAVVAARIAKLWRSGARLLNTIVKLGRKADKVNDVTQKTNKVRNVVNKANKVIDKASDLKDLAHVSKALKTWNAAVDFGVNSTLNVLNTAWLMAQFKWVSALIKSGNLEDAGNAFYKQLSTSEARVNHLSMWMSFGIIKVANQWMTLRWLSNIANGQAFSASRLALQKFAREEVGCLLSDTVIETLLTKEWMTTEKLMMTLAMVGTLWYVTRDKVKLETINGQVRMNGMWPDQAGKLVTEIKAWTYDVWTPAYEQRVKALQEETQNPMEEISTTNSVIKQDVNEKSDQIVWEARPTYQKDFDDKVIQKNYDLDDPQRVAAAAELLDMPLTDAQKAAVLQAHAVKRNDQGEYWAKELRIKAKILKDAGFKPFQRELLLRAGICGSEATPDIKNYTPMDTKNKTNYEEALAIDEKNGTSVTVWSNDGFQQEINWKKIVRVISTVILPDDKVLWWVLNDDDTITWIIKNTTTWTVREWNFKNNNLYGQGKITYKWKKGIREWNFKDGKLNGQGTVTFSDWTVREWNFEDNRFNGEGKVTFKDWEVRKGVFDDGKLNGIGSITRKDWEVVEWEFENGVYKSLKPPAQSPAQPPAQAQVNNATTNNPIQTTANSPWTQDIKTLKVNFTDESTKTWTVEHKNWTISTWTHDEYYRIVTGDIKIPQKDDGYTVVKYEDWKQIESKRYDKDGNERKSWLTSIRENITKNREQRKQARQEKREEKAKLKTEKATKKQEALDQQTNDKLSQIQTKIGDAIKENNSKIDEYKKQQSEYETKQQQYNTDKQTHEDSAKATPKPNLFQTKSLEQTEQSLKERKKELDAEKQQLETTKKKLETEKQQLEETKTNLETEKNQRSSENDSYIKKARREELNQKTEDLAKQLWMDADEIKAISSNSNRSVKQKFDAIREQRKNTDPKTKKIVWAGVGLGVVALTAIALYVVSSTKKPTKENNEAAWVEDSAGKNKKIADKLVADTIAWDTLNNYTINEASNESIEKACIKGWEKNCINDFINKINQDWCTIDIINAMPEIQIIGQASYIWQDTEAWKARNTDLSTQRATTVKDYILSKITDTGKKDAITAKLTIWQEVSPITYDQFKTSLATAKNKPADIELNTAPRSTLTETQQAQLKALTPTGNEYTDMIAFYQIFQWVRFEAKTTEEKTKTQTETQTQTETDSTTTETTTETTTTTKEATEAKTSGSTLPDDYTPMNDENKANYEAALAIDEKSGTTATVWDHYQGLQQESLFDGIKTIRLEYTSTKDNQIVVWWVLNNDGTITWIIMNKTNWNIQEWTFKDAKLNGQGTYTNKNWTIRKWDFKDGNLKGKGKITFKDWDTLVWDFEDDKLHGQWKRIDKEGRTIQEGKYTHWVYDDPQPQK